MKRKTPAKRKAATSRNRGTIKFVGLFVALSLTFYLAYYWLGGSFGFIRHNTAVVTGFFLSLVGMNTTVNTMGSDVILSVDGFSMNIIDECTAAFSSIVYTSAVLAYPTIWKNKALGLVGIPILYGLNIIRLSVVAVVGISHPDMFEYVHTYLWQAIFIIFVIGIFLLWINRVVRKARQKISS